MNRIRPRIRIFSILSSVCLLNFFALQYKWNWPLLKTSGILGTERFVDLYAIQEFATRIKNLGLDIYLPSEFGPGYQYSLGILYAFDFTNFTSLSRNAAAVIIEGPLLLIIVGTLLVSFNKGYSIGIFALLALSSPGIWLLLERGNLDILMAIFLMISALTFGTKYELMGLFTIIVSVGTKFYTAPLLLFYLLLGKKKYRRYIYLPSALLTLFLTLFQIFNVPMFPSTWYISFGSGSIGHWFNLFLEYEVLTNFRIHEKISLLIGTITLLGSCYVHYKFLPKLRYDEESKAQNYNYVADFFGLTFLACYVLGMNYDYRLVFPIISTIFFALSVDEIPYKKYFFSISMLSFWLSCYFHDLPNMTEIYLQLCGDIFIGLLTSYLAVYYFSKYYPKLKDFKKAF